MGTKWKKSKPAAAFAAFFLGASLLLGGLCTLSDVCARGWSGAYGVWDALSGDMRETAAFRREIEGTLSDFIAMAVGGPLDGGYLYDWSGLIEQQTAAVIDDEYGRWLDVWLSEGGAIQDAALYADYWGMADEDGALPDDAAHAEQEAAWARQAEAAHKQYAGNRNILYTISYDGKEKFSNAQGTGLTADPASLPEGYGFLLVYENGAVKIYRGNASADAYGGGYYIDVYGDGYYREDSAWCVPGYRNFPVDEESAKASVVLAAATTPRLYVTGSYRTSGTNWQYGGLYSVKQRLDRAWARLVGALGMCLAGLALAFLAWRMRGALRTAEAAIARATGRVWFEGKALAALLALVGIWNGWGVWYGATTYLADAGVWEVWRHNSAEGMSMLASQLGTAARVLLSSAPALLALFWLGWLLVNDLRHEPRPWRKSLYRDVLCARGLRLPLARRLVRRAGWTFAAALLLAAGGISCMAVTAAVPRAAAALVGACGLLLGLLAVLMALFLRQNRALARDVDALASHIAAMRSGALDTPLALEDGSDLAAAARGLNDLQRGMQTAIDEQMKSERMKVELVTNVSHDIKTPLTSIISYIELLRDEPGLPEHARDYVRILDEKSQRLKTMVQDVFEVSKAASGELPVRLEPLDFTKLLRQTLADMAERIAQSAVTVKTQLPDAPVLVVADGQRMYRVFQNLIGNALQYSLDGSRVYVALRVDGACAAADVRNASRVEIPAGKDFTARFVRGDESRTDGGSGLGLSIARSFTEACGGTLCVEAVADLFTVTVALPCAPEGAALQTQDATAAQEGAAGQAAQAE